MFILFIYLQAQVTYNQLNQVQPFYIYYWLYSTMIAHTKLQMESTRAANKVNSVAKGL